MAYAESTDELELIETVTQTVTDALEAASSLMDSRYFVLYETPIVSEDAGTVARLRRWCLAKTAYYLTANRPGQSEKVVKDSEAADAEMEAVRAGIDRLAGATVLEAPVRARAW